jgi:hypothetical protein
MNTDELKENLVSNGINPEEITTDTGTDNFELEVTQVVIEMLDGVSFSQMKDDLRMMMDNYFLYAKEPDMWMKDRVYKSFKQIDLALWAFDDMGIREGKVVNSKGI